MITVEKGQPASSEGRTETELLVYRALNELQVEFMRADHAPAMTMEDCVAIGEAIGAPVCKNLFLCNRQGTAFYLLMMPGDKPFRTKELSAQIGSARLSFASSEKMLEYLDILPGSVSVLGLMNDHENQVQLLIDEDVLAAKYVGCHPCVNTSSLRLETADLIQKILPKLQHDYRVVHLEGCVE